MAMTHSLTCGEPWQTTVPKYKDMFGKPATISVELDDTKKFLVWLPSERLIKLTELDETKMNTGSHKVTV